MEEPRIRILPKTQLAGLKTYMSYSHNTTGLLWKRFMPEYHKITDTAGKELYSVEVYDNPDFFRNFEPAREFEKWAAVAVESGAVLPKGFTFFVLPSGKYAVFNYKGKSGEAAEIYRYIYSEWIPNSKYRLDSRPHFALMGAKYKNDHPDSEEEIWIPVREK